MCHGWKRSTVKTLISVLQYKKIRLFVAWQTWDLLRICGFGLKSLLIDFKKRNPQHYLVLSRINGSAIESLFSQIKYATAGKLSSVNYGSSRRAVIISSK